MPTGSSVDIRTSSEYKPSRRFSATKLDTWQKCPLQARFKYRDKIPVARSAYMAFGIIVHQVLDERYEDPDLEMALDRFHELWDDPEKIDAAIDYWPETTD